MPAVVHSLKLSPALRDPLYRCLQGQRMEFRRVDHAAWQARGNDVVITWYNTNKVVVQGNDADRWIATVQSGGKIAPGQVASGGNHELFHPAPSPVGSDSTDAPRPASPTTTPSRAPASRFNAALQKHPVPDAAAWVGSDEVGKGDYFGPLVVAAVRIERGDLAWLDEMGIGDSKLLSDGAMMDMVEPLRARLRVGVATLSPPDYNAAYAERGNIARILDRLHAEAIALAMQGTTADFALSDQYSPAAQTGQLLRKSCPGLKWVQRPKAEEDPAVAAASIIARVAFLQGMDALEREVGHPLHRGAGEPTLRCARDLVRSHGAGVLPSVAKMHFKTTDHVLGGGLF
jgi:ribonuclease HIII